MEPCLSVLSAPCFSEVGPGAAPLDNIGAGAAQTQGVGEFALDAETVE